jgi:arsenate reductase
MNESEQVRQRERRAIDTLAEEFRGTFSRETIDRVFSDSQGRLADARVTEYASALTERLTRERLQALARVEGKITRGLPRVLFLCVHNAGRSQMAAGWFRHLAGNRALASSGGSEPAASVNTVVVEAMHEVGIDISEEYPKPLTDEVVRGADVVITMGCGDACPIYPGVRYIDWALDDPAGQPIEVVRGVRDTIEQRVRALLQEILDGSSDRASA